MLSKISKCLINSSLHCHCLHVIRIQNLNQFIMSTVVLKFYISVKRYIKPHQLHTKFMIVTQVFRSLKHA